MNLLGFRGWDSWCQFVKTNYPGSKLEKDSTAQKHRPTMFPTLPGSCLSGRGWLADYLDLVKTKERGGSPPPRRRHRGRGRYAAATAVFQMIENGALHHQRRRRKRERKIIRCCFSFLSLPRPPLFLPLFLFHPRLRCAVGKVGVRQH